MQRNIAGARAARHEVYGEWHRRWCSAMEQEQLAYSFRGKASDPNWKFTRIEIPTLLIAGEEDDFPFANIFSACRTLVKRADEKGTPHGTWVELNATGHSVHDERPALLAKLLHDHIAGSAGRSLS